ncbi:MAG: hypothetical protein R3288_10665 [Woeseiaceae bacterium]|nr:hypothetical protein [Woeseiaceae bacterium]
MDLSFQEKSAWGLLIGLVGVSLFYFPAAFAVAERVPHGAPLIAVSVVGVIALVVFEIVYHALIAAGGRVDAGDERDALIDLKAERNAAYVLGIGLFWLVGAIVWRSVVEAVPVPNPLQIAVFILLAITVSEVSKLLWQIWYYRTGV